MFKPMSNLYYVHHTAILDEGAKVGAGTKIWHFSHISSGAEIGTNCSIGQNVYVANDGVIGDNCKIQNNVSIYDKVILEENVFCGPSVVFTNVRNPRSYINRKNEYSETKICKGVTLGANSTIICGITLGSYAFIAAGAVVNMNIKPFALIAGVPGKQIGWMSKYGEQIPLPLIGKGEYKCPHTGEKYILEDGLLNLESV